MGGMLVMKRFIMAVLMLLFFLSGEGNILAADPQVDLKLRPEEFALSFLPFAKGEVAIIHLPGGINYLINTGERNQLKDLESILDKYGIRKIKGILITDLIEFHPDTLKAITEKWGVEEILTGSKLSEGFIVPGLNVRPLNKGEKIELNKKVAIDVVFEGSQVNEGLDFTVTALPHRFLWLSSHSPEAEDSLINEQLSDVNILKVPLYDKTELLSERLLNHIDPQTAIFYREKKKYINTDLLELFHESWIDVYFTGQHGLITIKFNENNYEVITFPEENQVLG
jgi:beta-lactamase superfamily II metal-dependent hydrolase